MQIERNISLTSNDWNSLLSELNSPSKEVFDKTTAFLAQVERNIVCDTLSEGDHISSPYLDYEKIEAAIFEKLSKKEFFGSAYLYSVQHFYDFTISLNIGQKMSTDSICVEMNVCTPEAESYTYKNDSIYSAA